MTSGYDYESEYHIDPHLPELFSTYLVDGEDFRPPVRAADTGHTGCMGNGWLWIAAMLIMPVVIVVTAPLWIPVVGWRWIADYPKGRK